MNVLINPCRYGKEHETRTSAETCLGCSSENKSIRIETIEVYKVNDISFEDKAEAVYERYRRKFELISELADGPVSRSDRSISQNHDAVFRFLVDEHDFVQSFIEEYIAEVEDAKILNKDGIRNQ